MGSIPEEFRKLLAEIALPKSWLIVNLRAEAEMQKVWEACHRHNGIGNAACSCHQAHLQHLESLEFLQLCNGSIPFR